MNWVCIGERVPSFLWFCYKGFAKFPNWAYMMPILFKPYWALTSLATSASASWQRLVNCSAEIASILSSFFSSHLSRIIDTSLSASRLPFLKVSTTDLSCSLSFLICFHFNSLCLSLLSNTKKLNTELWIWQALEMGIEGSGQPGKTQNWALDIMNLLRLGIQEMKCLRLYGLLTTAPCVWTERDCCAHYGIPIKPRILFISAKNYCVD